MSQIRKQQTRRRGLTVKAGVSQPTARYAPDLTGADGVIRAIDTTLLKHERPGARRIH